MIHTVKGFGVLSKAEVDVFLELSFMMCSIVLLDVTAVFNVKCELPDVQLDLEKAEEPEIKLPISAGS